MMQLDPAIPLVSSNGAWADVCSEAVARLRRYAPLRAWYGRTPTTADLRALDEPYALPDDCGCLGCSTRRRLPHTPPALRVPGGVPSTLPGAQMPWPLAALPPRGRMERIVGHVCTYYGLTPHHIERPLRTPEIVEARMIACHLGMTEGQVRLQDVARGVSRDHSTCNHALRVVATRLAEEETLPEVSRPWTSAISDIRALLDTPVAPAADPSGRKAAR